MVSSHVKKSLLVNDDLNCESSDQMFSWSSYWGLKGSNMLLDCINPPETSSSCTRSKHYPASARRSKGKGSEGNSGARMPAGEKGFLSSPSRARNSVTASHSLSNTCLVSHADCLRVLSGVPFSRTFVENERPSKPNACHEGYQGSY